MQLSKLYGVVDMAVFEHFAARCVVRRIFNMIDV